MPTTEGDVLRIYTQAGPEEPCTYPPGVVVFVRVGTTQRWQVEVECF